MTSASAHGQLSVERERILSALRLIDDILEGSPIGGEPITPSSSSGSSSPSSFSSPSIFPSNTMGLPFLPTAVPVPERDDQASAPLTRQQPNSGAVLEFEAVDQLVRRLEAAGWRKALLKDRSWRFRKYPNCATGKGIAKYLQSIGEAASAEQAVILGRSLLKSG